MRDWLKGGVPGGIDKVMYMYITLDVSSLYLRMTLEEMEARMMQTLGLSFVLGFA